MFRLESYELAKARQDEKLRDAQRARLAARINRREHRTSDLRTVLGLLTLHKFTTIRQG